MEILVCMIMGFED